MESVTVQAKLNDASERLSHFAKQLYVTEHLPKENQKKFRICVNNRRAVANAANNALGLTKKLAWAGEEITKRTPGRKKATSPSLKKFHCFNQLPAELRLMVWQAASQPPPCAHYFASHTVGERDRPPAAYLLEDGGLWTACQESRRVIVQAYDKMHKHVQEEGCSAAYKAMETHYRRIGRFNRDGRQLQKNICVFYRVFKERYHKLGPVPSGYKRLYRTYLGEEEDVLGEKLIHWRTLFEPIKAET